MKEIQHKTQYNLSGNHFCIELAQVSLAQIMSFFEARASAPLSSNFSFSVFIYISNHVHLSEYVLMSEFDYKTIISLIIFLQIVRLNQLLLLTLKYFTKIWNSVHLIDARALKSERLAFQSCFKLERFYVFSFFLDFA